MSKTTPTGYALWADHFGNRREYGVFSSVGGAKAFAERFHVGPWRQANNGEWLTWGDHNKALNTVDTFCIEPMGK